MPCPTQPHPNYFVHNWKPLHPNAPPTLFFSIQPPLNFTIINYLSSISSTLASQIFAQNEPFPSPFATAAYCLNVTSLAIWSVYLSPPVRNNQAHNYGHISRKNRQLVCFISVSLSLDICFRRPMSFTVIPSWNSALN